ncbi:hypothetical protein ACFVVM_11275 [Nocardia sp. NPDC058176]|uniref:hypothetical protein n=1 Tax=Nocardia sp. NPDC058176 TaxID=3346368 RepID=UPI0036DBCEE5
MTEPTAPPPRVVNGSTGRQPSSQVDRLLRGLGEECRIMINAAGSEAAEDRAVSPDTDFLDHARQHPAPTSRACSP